MEKIKFHELGAKYGFGWSENHCRQVIKLGQQLYKEVVALGLLPTGSDSDLQVIQDAGFVHDIGRSHKAVGEGEHNVKSVATLKKELGSMACAEEHNQLVLYCVHYHTGDEWKETHAEKEVSPDLLGHAKRLCGLFRIADALDHGLQNRVRGISLALDSTKLSCKIFAASNEARVRIKYDEMIQATKKSDLLKKAFGLKEANFEIAKD